MTKRHDFLASTGKDYKPYFFIDGKRVSETRFRDSIGRSERAMAQARAGSGTFLPSGAKGRFVALEPVERLPEEPSIPRTTAIIRERIRGTRRAILKKYVLPMDSDEARTYLEGQYDRGGNYVLHIKRMRTDMVPPGIGTELFDEFDLGDDGSADLSP